MEAVIAVIVLLFVLCLALGAYATVKVVGAAKRGVDRTITQARRTVEDHTLRAKSFAQLGPAGEIAQLRLALRTSMRATQDALHAGVVEDESLKESLGLSRGSARTVTNWTPSSSAWSRSRTVRRSSSVCRHCGSARSGSRDRPTRCAGPPVTVPAASRRTTSTPSAPRSASRPAPCGTGPRRKPTRRRPRGPRRRPPTARRRARPGRRRPQHAPRTSRPRPPSPRPDRARSTPGRRSRDPRAPPERSPGFGQSVGRAAGWHGDAAVVAR